MHVLVNKTGVNMIILTQLFLVISSCTSNVFGENLKVEIEKNEKLYICEDSVSYRNIKIVQEKNEAIYFVMSVTNKKDGKEKTITGNAIMGEGDLEVEEDEEGDSYPAYAYFYEKGNVYIEITIDSKERKLLKVRTTIPEYKTDKIFRIKQK